METTEPMSAHQAAQEYLARFWRVIKNEPDGVTVMAEIYRREIEAMFTRLDAAEKGRDGFAKEVERRGKAVQHFMDVAKERADQLTHERETTNLLRADRNFYMNLSAEKQVEIANLRTQLAQRRDMTLTAEKLDESLKFALMTYNGGYSTDNNISIFHHGIETAFRLVKADLESAKRWSREGKVEVNLLVPENKAQAERIAKLEARIKNLRRELEGHEHYDSVCRALTADDEAAKE